MKEVVLVGGVRTPIGLFSGVLKDVTAQELGTLVIKELISRFQVPVNQIDDVILGWVAQSSDAPNIARVCLLMAGIPEEITGYTVHRNCASGMQAVISAAQMIKAGDADLIIAGGTESMSNVPYIVRKARFGYRLRHGEFTDALWEGLTDPITHEVMGQTAENLAEKYNITREEQDEYTIKSHQKAINAIKENKFKDEIIPVPIKQGKEIKFCEIDETPRDNLTMEKLASFPTIFKKNGSVTAANSCSINDGASAILVMSKEKAKELGYEPYATITGYGFAGVSPSIMGIGPAYAIPKALKKANLTLDKIDLFELNEAFAAQNISVHRELNFNWEKVNVNGGGLALGHPVGSTGCRLVITLLHEMQKRNLKKGLAGLCVGGGMGSAIIIER